jgi:hypothetical protein
MLFSSLGRKSSGVLADPATAEVAQGERVPNPEGHDDEAGHAFYLDLPKWLCCSMGLKFG